MSKTAYIVVFGIGGRDNTVWHKSLPMPTLGAAEASARRVVRQGYPAYVKTSKEVELLGLPVGPAPLWDYRNLQWVKEPALGVGC